MSIIVTQSLSWEIESNAFFKSTKHIYTIEWLLVLACLVHHYSKIRDLVSCLPFKQSNQSRRVRLLCKMASKQSQSIVPTITGTHEQMSTHAGNRCHVADASNLFCNHPQLLKVDQTFHGRIITEMNECQVLLHQWEKWNLSNNIVSK